MFDAKKAESLFEGWNNGCVKARDALIELVYDKIVQFSKGEFFGGKTVSTPVKLFDFEDIANTVSLVLCEKQSKIKFDHVGDMLSYIRRMVYNVVIDHARKFTRTNYGDPDYRVRAAECDEVVGATVDDSSHEVIELELLEKIAEQFEIKHKEFAVMLDYQTIFDLSAKAIAEITGADLRRVYRGLEFAQAFYIAELKKAKVIH